MYAIRSYYERETINQNEEALLAEINRYFEITRPLERQMEEARVELRRKIIRPHLDREVTTLLHCLTPEGENCPKLAEYLEQVSKDILDKLELFQNSTDGEEEDLRTEALNRILSRYRVNLVVDNCGLQGAPVIIEDNPLYRSLFGSIEYHTENEVLVTDFSLV